MSDNPLTLEWDEDGLHLTLGYADNLRELGDISRKARRENQS